MILFSARAIEHLGSIYMMTINVILPKLLCEPKNPYCSFVIFCFFRLRFSAEILSPYGVVPSQSGFLEFVVSP